MVIPVLYPEMCIVYAFTKIRPSLNSISLLTLLHLFDIVQLIYCAYLLYVNKYLQTAFDTLYDYDCLTQFCVVTFAL